MPISPTRGELRYPGNPDAAEALDDFDRAERARTRHRGKYPSRACPAHPGDVDGQRECRDTINAVEAARAAVKTAEANPPQEDTDE